MTSALHHLLLTLLLVQFSSPSPPPRRVWKCTGPQSKYSYLDCERDYSYSDGCYYVEHFSQFRPCAWICNDIEFNSIDEERCRAFCSKRAHLRETGSVTGINIFHVEITASVLVALVSLAVMVYWISSLMNSLLMGRETTPIQESQDFSAVESDERPASVPVAARDDEGG